MAVTAQVIISTGKWNVGDRGWVTENDGNLNMWMEADGRTVTIDNIQVAEAERNKGIFRRFMGMLEAHATHSGYKVINIRRVSNTTLASALQRYGYRLKEGTRNQYTKELG